MKPNNDNLYSIGSF